MMNRATNDSYITCDDVRLDVLLNEQEESEQFVQSLTHVDTCADCQQRLTEMAGNAGNWRSVGEILSSYPELECDSLNLNKEVHIPTVDGLSTEEQNRFVADILDAPSHPEMLGRIGRYEIESVIGSGGMGVVLRGFDSDLNRPVAIKVLARHLSHSGAARQRFARESRAAAAVVNEHVVAIHSVETSGDTPFLVMHYVAGESLQARVDRDGPLSGKEVLRIGLQVATGLQAAHEQGVMHRDIKPANILLEQGVDRALVSDFGLARTVDDASLTHTGVLAGTPNYMSPEQARGLPTDTRTDLFSLGALLYFMATGRPPFRAERAMGVLHRICHEPHKAAWRVSCDVPDRLSDIIDQLLEKKPSRRFSSAAELQTALKSCLADIQQPRRRHSTQLRRWFRQYRTAVVAAGWSSLALTAAAVLWQVTGMNDSSSTRTNKVQNNTPMLGQERRQQEDSRQVFTVDTWQQASDEESNQWTSNIRSLDASLTELEGAWSPPDPSDNSAWQQNIETLRRKLDSFASESFTREGNSL